MPIIDNGDITRAVGFVAIYGAYLEDRIAELVELTEKHIDLRKNIHKLSATDQARHLLKSLKDQFDNIPDYFSKADDKRRTITVLGNIEEFLKERHHVIHSILISDGGDIITQKNRRTGSEEPVKSNDLIDLANDIYELQSQVSGLKFPIRTLLGKILEQKSS